MTQVSGLSIRRARLQAAGTARATRRVLRVVPVGGAAERRPLQHLQREQRALHAGRRDVDPEQLEHERLVEPQQVVDGHALDLVGHERGRRLRDRAAVAAERHLGDPALVVEHQLHAQLVAAERVVVLELEVGGLQRAEVVRSLVVLEDLLPVELVHGYAKILLTSARPSTRASTSASVLCTPIDAREVAGTPSARISGCAQWWPARTHTPSRARISATSCGCTPSSANEIAVPRGSTPAGGPMIDTSSTSSSRSSAYCTSADSWASTASMPSPSSQRIAAPSPAASTYGEVPASNFHGSAFQRDSKKSTREIMSPPARNGGISSSSSRRAYSTPMPVGP